MGVQVVEEIVEVPIVKKMQRVVEVPQIQRVQKFIDVPVVEQVEQIVEVPKVQVVEEIMDQPAVPRARARLLRAATCRDAESCKFYFWRKVDTTIKQSAVHLDDIGFRIIDLHHATMS